MVFADIIMKQLGLRRDEEFQAIFPEFSPEPLASGAIAQVHKAKIRKSIGNTSSDDHTDSTRSHEQQYQTVVVKGKRSGVVPVTHCLLCLFCLPSSIAFLFVLPLVRHPNVVKSVITDLFIMNYVAHLVRISSITLLHDYPLSYKPLE